MNRSLLFLGFCIIVATLCTQGASAIDQDSINKVNMEQGIAFRAIVGQLEAKKDSLSKAYSEVIKQHDDNLSRIVSKYQQHVAPLNDEKKKLESDNVRVVDSIRTKLKGKSEEAISKQLSQALNKFQERSYKVDKAIEKIWNSYQPDVQKLETASKTVREQYESQLNEIDSQIYALRKAMYDKSLTPKPNAEKQ